MHREQCARSSAGWLRLPLSWPLLLRAMKARSRFELETVPRTRTKCSKAGQSCALAFAHTLQNIAYHAIHLICRRSGGDPRLLRQLLCKLFFPHAPQRKGSQPSRSNKCRRICFPNSLRFLEIAEISRNFAIVVTALRLLHVNRF